MKATISDTSSYKLEEREEADNDSETEKDTINMQETILKYLDKIYPNYNWSWYDVLRHTNEEAIFIIKLYEQAIRYFTENKEDNRKEGQQ